MNAINTVTATAFDLATARVRWEEWRAARIVALIKDGLTYADAVTWSRRELKREGLWH